MKVKLLAPYASPSGTHDIGAVIDVEKKEADQLIAGRYAEPHGIAAKVTAAVAGGGAPEKKTTKQPETRTGGGKPPAKGTDPKKDAPKDSKVQPPQP